MQLCQTETYNAVWYNSMMVYVSAAVVCVTLLNRLIDDQIRADKPTLMEYEMRPAQLVAKYMLKQLNQK